MFELVFWEVLLGKFEPLTVLQGSGSYQPWQQIQTEGMPQWKVMHRADASDIFLSFLVLPPPFLVLVWSLKYAECNSDCGHFFFFFFFGVWVCVMLSSSNVASGRKPEAEMTHSYRVLLPFHHSGRFQYCNWLNTCRCEGSPHWTTTVISGGVWIYSLVVSVIYQKFIVQFKGSKRWPLCVHKCQWNDDFFGLQLVCSLHAASEPEATVYFYWQ